MPEKRLRRVRDMYLQEDGSYRVVDHSHFPPNRSLRQGQISNIEIPKGYDTIEEPDNFWRGVVLGVFLGLILSAALIRFVA